MNEYRYVTMKQQIGEGNAARVCYGIAAAHVYDGCVQLIQTYDDLSDDGDSVTAFCEAM